MFIDIDTSLLDDKECKKCKALMIYCNHNNINDVPDIQKIYDATGIDLYEIANNRILSKENKELILKNNITLQDLQEFKNKTEITACTLGFLWKDLLNKIDNNATYQFMCKHKYPTCDGQPGYFCFYHF